MDRESTDILQGRPALVAKELSHYSIDIAALSETQLKGKGSLTESASGYAFFWKGKVEMTGSMELACHQGKSDETTPSVVCWNQWEDVEATLAPQPKVACNSQQCLCPHQDKCKIDHWEVHADLISILLSVTANDKLILLANFNTHIGCDHSQFEGVFGKHGIGKMNSNGLTICSKYRVWTPHHKLGVQTGKQVQDYLDEPHIQAVAYDWLCYHLPAWYQRCPHHQSHERNRLLDRSHACLHFL